MIITLCGSNRFESHFKIWNELLSLAGHVVFTTSCYPSFKDDVKEWYTSDEKQMLDLVHMAKIDASDAVLILNVCGYVGDSTINELTWAKLKEKRLYALESWGVGCGIGNNHTEEYQNYKKSLNISDDYAPKIDTSKIRCPFSLLPLGLSGRADKFKKQEIENAQQCN